MTDEIKLHVLGCGALGCDKQVLIGDPQLRGNRHDHYKRATWYSCTLHCVLIEHPDGLFLWDTAAPRDWESRWAGTGLEDVVPYDQVTEEEYLDARLRQLGYEAGDLDLVIASHLHLDHAGNLRGFAGGKTRLLCHEDELSGAQGFEGFFEGGHVKADYEGLEFETVKGDTQIAEGVTLLETPGHTWGTMSLQVDLPHDGTMIFTSDAVYLQRSLELRNWGGIVWDNRRWLASVDKLVGIAERTNATMVFGHDSDQFATLRHAPDAHYR